VLRFRFGTFTWSEKVLAPAEGLFVVPPFDRCQNGRDVKYQSYDGGPSLSEFAKLKLKDWIVINAANSQIARCLIAIAQARDLKIAGIVRRSELIPEVEKLGADFVGVESPELPKQIQIATGGMPISLGLDAVGGPATATMASVLPQGLIFVIYAWLSGAPIQVSQGDLIVKRLSIHGFWMYYEEFSPKCGPHWLRQQKWSLPEINFANHDNVQTVPNQKKQSNTPSGVARFLWDFNHSKLEEIKL